MSDYCAVAICTNYRRKTTGISYYRFPKDPKLRKVWIARCYRADKFDPDDRYCTICSSHFKMSDFERDMRAELLKHTPRRILIEGAIPSQNLRRDEMSWRLRRQIMLAREKQEETLTAESDFKTSSSAATSKKPDSENSDSEDCSSLTRENEL